MRAVGNKPVGAKMWEVPHGILRMMVPRAGEDAKISKVVPSNGAISVTESIVIPEAVDPDVEREPVVNERRLMRSEKTAVKRTVPLPDGST